MRKLFLMVCLVSCLYAPAQISRIEYYFNNDPGIGNATAVTFPSATDVANHYFAPSTAGLSDGLNRLYVRSRDANGVWGQTANELFYKVTTTTIPAAVSLVKMEYYFNTDPGKGNGIAVALPAATDAPAQVFTPSTTALPQGLNRFYVRTLDANGIWSQTANQVFYKLGAAAISNIDKIEYYFNTDPGIGNGIQSSVTPGTDISGQVFTPDITALASGLNRMYIRSRDANGIWSQTASQVFYKLGAAAISNIDKIEYYFNTDPGIGNGIQASFAPGTDISGQVFTPDMTALASGLNRMYIRSRDANGTWSQTANQLFYKLPQAIAPSAITTMEYFIGSDPGYGKAVPLVFNPADSITDFSFPINIAGLNAGNHFLQIRSKDADGKWSLNANDTVTISTPVTGPAIIINSILTNATNFSGAGFADDLEQLANANLAAICAGTKVALAFDPSGGYDTSNVFTVQLSDDAGSFANPVAIGQTKATTGHVVLNALPRHLLPGTNYRIRVVGSSPMVVGDANMDAITINDVNLGPDTTIYHACLGETTNLLQLFPTNGLGTSWTTANPSAAPPASYTLIANNAANCPDTAIAIIKLETAFWTGTVSSNWHDPANWNINKVPTDKTHVIVSGSTPHNCVISNANAQAASIQVKNGATVQTINNKQADVNGKCSVLPPG